MKKYLIISLILAISFISACNSYSSELDDLQSKIDDVYEKYPVLSQQPNACYLIDNGATIYSFCNNYSSAGSGHDLITVDDKTVTIYTSSSIKAYERPKVLISKSENLALVLEEGPSYRFAECKSSISTEGDVVTKPTIMLREQVVVENDLNGRPFKFHPKTTEERCNKYVTMSVRNRCFLCSFNIYHKEGTCDKIIEEGYPSEGLERFGYTSVKDECIGELAIAKDDITYCDKLPSQRETAKYFCIRNFAFSKRDLALCSLIKDNTRMDECKKIIIENYR